ncbi:MAG: hypothetical protein M5R42_17980, partial [Rhodocyclaceae bacterium]|nr:hypothetical protein [Rhodocyclaceae bacterium]
LDLSAVDEKKVRWFLKRAREAQGYPLAADTPVSEALAHLDLLSGRPTHPVRCPPLWQEAAKLAPASEVKCLHFHGTEPVKPTPRLSGLQGQPLRN